MKRLLNIFIVLFCIVFILLLTNGNIRYVCPIKYLTNIRCPGCGLTRSFRAILNLDFYNAYSYNILGVPLFVTVIIVMVSMIIDIVKNTNKTLLFILNFLKKYYFFIIIIIIITMIVNNIKGI